MRMRLIKVLHFMGCVMQLTPCQTLHYRSAVLRSKGWLRLHGADLDSVPGDVVEVQVLIDVQPTVLAEEVRKIHDPRVQLHHLGSLWLHHRSLNQGGDTQY